MVQLDGNTIRNVSRGVVGVALVQSFFAGLGFLAAGVPAAGFLAFLALLLGIIQIGPAILLIPIIIWSWLAMETTTAAVVFTVYMLVVGLMDNVLKPIVMARGGGNAYAGHSYWGHRRDHSLRDQRLVFGPDHLVGSLGIARGLGAA